MCITFFTYFDFYYGLSFCSCSVLPYAAYCLELFNFFDFEPEPCLLPIGSKFSITNPAVILLLDDLLPKFLKLLWLDALIDRPLFLLIVLTRLSADDALSLRVRLFNCGLNYGTFRILL